MPRVVPARVDRVDAGQAGAADDAWRRAAGHARRAGDERELFDILCWRASAAVFGPTPVPEAIRRCEEIRERVRGSPVALAVTLHPLGALHAMPGDFESARRLIREGNEILDELGRLQSAVSHHEALVELLAGEPAAAEARLRRATRSWRRWASARSSRRPRRCSPRRSGAGPPRGGRRAVRVGEAAAADEDVATQAMWRGVRARLLAAGGRAEAAEALAREAVELVERTDLLTHHADALLDLAEVARVAGRRRARRPPRQALALYERKGNVVSAGRARSWLASGGGDETTEVDGGAALAVRKVGDAR